MKKLKVLDISQGVAGPLCANLLWQNGAEVIKVEPQQGDWARHIGKQVANQSPLTISYNVGKKGVSIDAKTEQGRQIILNMAKQCDVFVQNFRPGVVERLGLSYEDLLAVNQDIIYVSISGYGAVGPYSLSPATDSVMQAETGLMNANRLINNQPHKVGVIMVDILSGMQAAMQVLSTIAKSAINGKKQGRHIDLNLFDASVSFQVSNIITDVLQDDDEHAILSAPNGYFKANNGYINIITLNNKQFHNLARAIDKEEWIEDDRFATNENRILHKDYLHDVIQTIVETKSIDEWLNLFKQHDVLHAPIRDYKQVLSHEQSKVNQTFDYFSQNGTELPFAFMSGLDNKPELKPAPKVGEHTVSVLDSFGFSKQQITEYLDQSVIFQS